MASQTVVSTHTFDADKAAAFVQKANGFRSVTHIRVGAKQTNAKSIMGVLSICIVKDNEVTVTADGDDEDKACVALADFIKG
jgi:phosphotransferase system HPr (HPr) family protein